MTIEQQEDSRKDVVSGGTDIPMDDFSGTEPGMTADTEDDVDMIDEIQRDTVEVPDEYDDNPPCFSFRKLWAFTGPGFLMSIAYLDPGNIESDLRAGAGSGYTLLWVLLWSTVIGLILQMLAARLGVVTGKHLAELCREKYGAVPRYFLWVMTEIAIIGSDIQEVVGSAVAIQILTQIPSIGFAGIPLWIGCIITAADTFTFLFLEKYGVRKLEAFFGFLVSVMAITFGVEYFISDPDELQVLKGTIVPTLGDNRGPNLLLAVGILGAVIMPHNIYLHSALVQSRKVDRTRPIEISEANKYYTIESAIALGLSFVINLFVVAVFGAAAATGDQNCGDPSQLGLNTAGDYLQCKFGTVALYIWGVGLLAAGQSSTMTGTYAGQFVMQGFLRLTIAPWKRVLITRSVAILPAVIVAVVAEAEIDTLDEMLNVLQSIQLPFALLPVLKLTSDYAVMGEFKNNIILSLVCWLFAIVIIIVNYLQIIYDLRDASLWLVILSAVIGGFYLFVVVYFTIEDIPFIERLIGRVFPSFNPELRRSEYIQPEAREQGERAIN